MVLLCPAALGKGSLVFLPAGKDCYLHVVQDLADRAEDPVS